MLLQISIRNFAIFKDAAMEPGAGYNVITGESGAGKSVIVNAISLICGARAYKEMIRTGEDYARVEAVFRVPDSKKELINELLSDNEDLLVITRDIFRDKPSVCKLNGKIRNLSLITSVSTMLMDIHGQYENQTLMDVENHIKYLDAFAGRDFAGKLSEYNKLQKEYSNLINELISVSGGDSERERNRQILEFQIEEITSAALDNIDESSLHEKKTLMENSEKYRLASGAALAVLGRGDESVTDLIRNSIKEIESLPENDTLNKIISSMNDAFFQLQEAEYDLTRFSESIDFNDSEYEELLDFFEKLRDLKRKYGPTVEDILNFRNEADIQLERINNFKRNYARNLEKIELLSKRLEKMDDNLSSLRKKASEGLIRLLVSELTSIGMKDSVMNMKFSRNETVNQLGFPAFAPDGRDTCEFLISLNKGLNPGPLAKVASGGEMSRIMLAFKSVFCSKDDTDTVVFDEIDSGISGEASKAVSEKLYKLSESRQLICITHQPRIASMAEHHFVIRKTSTEDETIASIGKIENHTERIDVIASMTDGDIISPEGRKHAQQLLNDTNTDFN